MLAEEIIARLRERAPGRAVINALNSFLAHDSYLLEVDANERSISHRFAMYLQSELPDLHVDCEYNRDGVEPKKIEYLGLNPNDEDTDARSVFPDVIAHIRNSKRNYLVIEIKKNTNQEDRTSDFAKLRGYRRSLGYTHALFVEFDARDGAGVSYVEWVTT